MSCNEGDLLPQLNLISGKIAYFGIQNAFLLNTVLVSFKKMLLVLSFTDGRVTLSYYLICFMHKSVC